jgi:hypothetical protein
LRYGSARLSRIPAHALPFAQLYLQKAVISRESSSRRLLSLAVKRKMVVTQGSVTTRPWQRLDTHEHQTQTP